MKEENTLAALLTARMPFLGDITVKDTCESTNDDIKALIKSGCSEWTTVIALSQTKGRGRMGRSFISAKGGLYFSVALYPDISADKIYLITVLAAVAVSRAIEKVSGKKCAVKWVNDIYIEDKKVCGILTEGVFSDKTGAVLGIGVNLGRIKGGLSPEITDIADCVLDTEADDGIKADFLACFFEVFNSFYKNLGLKEFLDEYRNRMFLKGKEITYEKGGILHSAKVLDVDENAHLKVIENGKIFTLFAGEVSVRKKFL